MSQVLGTALCIQMAAFSREQRLEEKDPSKALEMGNGNTAGPQGS